MTDEPSDAIKALIHKIVADPEAYEHKQQIQDRRWAANGWSTYRLRFVDEATAERIASDLDSTNPPMT